VRARASRTDGSGLAAKFFCYRAYGVAFTHALDMI
jgi:hypothetical protein